MLTREHSAPPAGHVTRRQTDRSDLQPAVGSREEEVGRVVGVGQLQHPLLETGLVSAEGHDRHRRCVVRLTGNERADETDFAP